MKFIVDAVKLSVKGMINATGGCNLHWIANQCQPREAKRVGVQVPPLLQRSRKMRKWHPPPELVGPLWPCLLDRYTE